MEGQVYHSPNSSIYDEEKRQRGAVLSGQGIQISRPVSVGDEAHRSKLTSKVSVPKETAKG